MDIYKSAQAHLKKVVGVANSLDVEHNNTKQSQSLSHEQFEQNKSKEICLSFSTQGGRVVTIELPMKCGKNTEPVNQEGALDSCYYKDELNKFIPIIKKFNSGYVLFIVGEGSTQDDRLVECESSFLV